MPSLSRFCAISLLAAITITTQVYAQPAPDAAANYPSKPVRWIVPFTPGASTDVIARLIADKLSDAWGKQFIVDNRAGAGGLVGSDAVAKSPPDGYTVLLSTMANVTGPLLTKEAPFGVDDFAHVIYFGYSPLIILAHPGFPPKTPRELVDYLKANPGKVNWGSSGTNGPTHVAAALFQIATGTQFTHVPYKGNAPAQTDLIAGQIQLLEASFPSVDSQIKAGRIRAIAVADARRLTLLPNVSTLAEGGISGADAVAWFGMSAPAKTPRPTIAKLNAEIRKILVMPDVKRRLDEFGVVEAAGSPDDFTRFFENEVERLRKLIKAGLLKPE